MIYPLAGCDTRPGLGATFSQRADRAWQVAEVEPKGFVAGMGLLPGDVITWAGIAQRQSPHGVHHARADRPVPRPGQGRGALPRGHRGERPPHPLPPPPIGILDVPLPRIGTTKRNNPVLTLMVGEDREWVLWTPQGYYDTSIVGDWRYLGWHINADYRASRSADFVPMGTYCRDDAAAGDPGAALADGRSWTAAIRVAGPPAGTPPLDQQARDNQPPKITFGPVAGGIRLPASGLLWKVGVPDPQIELNITAPESSRLTARRVVIDEQPMELPPLAAPATRHSEVLRLRLTPRPRSAAGGRGDQREPDLAHRDDGPDLPAEGTASRTSSAATVHGPADRAEPSATSSPPNRQLLPPVRFADKDAKTLAGSLADHLVSRDGDEVPAGREGGPPRAGRRGGLGRSRSPMPSTS